MNRPVRHIAIAACLALSPPAAASAPEQPHVWAEIAPRAEIPPEAPPGPPCDGDTCALKAIPDLWKRDAVKREHTPRMNANTIILGRAQFLKDAARFQDTPPILNYDILGSGVCIGPDGRGTLGLHNC
ncbi:MAG TPA: hypothetical protein VL899_06385 [Alphaproteobacteria bacterium]|nr:hypothetical protein [Alphaproteobacteria bacterium]